jgi:hypothetical protein
MSSGIVLTRLHGFVTKCSPSTHGPQGMFIRKHGKVVEKFSNK